MAGINFDEMPVMSSSMVYTGNGMKEVKQYINVGSTASGLVTFQLTVDGKNSGEAIFKSVLGITATALLSATTAGDTPRCTPRALSADRKVLTVQTSQGGAALTIAGLAAVGVDKWVPDGTKVYVTVYGE